MKEYKLSRKSKYSVFYLLSGLFMFFFMFAILNLSSYATGAFSGGNFSLASKDSYDFSYPVTYSYGYNVRDYKIPYTDIAVYSRTAGYSGTGASNCPTSNEFHLVTTQGDFCIDTENDLTTSYYTIPGVPISSYVKGSAYNPNSGTVTFSRNGYVTYIGVRDFYDDFFEDSNGLPQLSDYSSYSFVSAANQVEFDSVFDLPIYKTGSPVFYNFNPYSGNHYYTAPRTAISVSRPKDKCKYMFLFSCTSSISSLTLNVRDLADVDGSQGVIGAGVYVYNVSDMIVNTLYDEQYFYYCFLELDEGIDTRFLLFNFDVTTTNNCDDFCFACLQYKATISDYMNYVQKNYQDINPSVIDLNQNTAQSVSDIGTAQTFETSAFDNFNNQMSSSGLDSFSLSYASTPLLWVSSIITNFYNNMPSTFQYLLMFVAFIGILCTVLNVFGRVAQRFGGDNPNKANSKDVFSYIEKHGSI